MLVGYVAVPTRRRSTATRPRPGCARSCRPRSCRCSPCVDDLPTRTSGKVDRAALPWPLPGVDDSTPRGLDAPTEGWLAEQWQAVLGVAGDRARRELLRPRRRQSSPRRSSSRRIRARDPEVTVADIYDAPAARRAGRRARRASTPATGPPRSATSTPTPRGTQWLQTLARRAAVHPERRAVAALPAHGERRSCAALGAIRRPARPSSLVVLVVGLARLRHPARPDRDRRRSARGCCCAACDPGDYPRGGSVHLRLWVAEQARRSWSARSSLAGAPWITLLRPRARREDRPRRRPAHRCRRSPACSRSATARRSSPRSTSPATGSTATSCTSAGSGSAPSAHDRRPQHAAARRPDRQGRRDRAGLGGVRRACRPVSAGPGRPPTRVGTADGRWPPTPAAAPRRWVVAYGVTSLLLGAAAGRRARRRRRRDRRRHRRLATTLGEARAAGARARSSRRPWSPGWSLRRRSSWSRVRLLGIGLARGRPPGAQPDRLAGLDHRAADGHGAHRACSRSTRACSRPSGCGCSAPTVGRDVEASTVLAAAVDDHDRATARSSPTTRWSRSYELRRRLDAHRAGAASASGRSSATPGWPRPAAGARSDGLVGVLSAAPREGEDGLVLARLAADAAAPRRARRPTRAARSDPPRRLRVARGAVGALPDRAGDRHVRASASACCSRSRALDDRAAACSSPLLLSGVVMLAAGARRRAASRRSRSGLLVGPDPRSASTRCGARSSGATSWPTRSSRWSPRRGSPSAAAGTPALAVWLRTLGARSAAACGARRYWLPEADLVTPRRRRHRQPRLRRADPPVP